MYKVLSFGAHPDDIEIGCAGSELKLIKNGCEVHHAIMTSGGEGSKNTPPLELIKIREEEAKKSANIIGASSVHFFGYEDGLTGFTKKMRKEVIAHIRNINPDIIFMHASCDHSFDHEVVFKLITAAIGPSQGPWYPELVQVEPKLKAVFGYEVWNPINTPGFILDISNEINTKIQALECHKSQLATVDYDRAVSGINQYRGALSGEGEYAEAFEVIKISPRLDYSIFS